MKKLFCLALSICFLTVATFAQKTATDEDYQRYIESRMELEFRKKSIEAAELTSAEIIRFDPIFNRYMAGKERLLEKKINLLEDYSAELKENASVENQANDRADFVESYWEVEIEEMKLSKNYFDILEDKIPVKKVLKFFLFEGAVQNRLTQVVLATMIPSVGNLNQIVDKAVLNNRPTTIANKILVKDDTVSDKDYNRYIESRLEMDFRNESIKAIDLTSDEILAFDPIFQSYMAAKERLLEKKINLMEDIREELKEDDSVKNEEEDIADFVEDYWEVEIAEKELSKDYFKKLEDKIAVDKANKFFLWEDAVQHRVKLNLLESMVPAIVIVKSVKIKKLHGAEINPKVKLEVMDTKVVAEKEVTKTAPVMNISDATMQSVRSFNEWVTSNKGKVNLSHDYTSNGLKVLIGTLDALKTDLKLQVTNYEQNKQTILSAANHITINKKETNHADKTKEAFTAVASIMNDMSPTKNGALSAIARKMNPDQLMTPQAKIIYQFFDEASAQLKQMTEMKYSSIN